MGSGARTRHMTFRDFAISRFRDSGSGPWIWVRILDKIKNSRFLVILVTLRIVPNIWHPTAFLDVIIDFSGFHDCASGSQSNTGVITFITLGVTPHSHLFTLKKP